MKLRTAYDKLPAAMTRIAEWTHDHAHIIYHHDEVAATYSFNKERRNPSARDKEINIIRHQKGDRQLCPASLYNAGTECWL